MITCTVHVEHDRVDRGMGNTAPTKWSIAATQQSPEDAANVLRSWAAKGYAVRIETDTPSPVDVTIS